METLNPFLILSSLILLAIFHAVSKRVLHKLRNLPPTPPLALPVVGHLYLLSLPLYRSLAEVSRRWGQLLYLRLGSHDVVLISSPAAAEECMTKNDVVSANRPRFLAGKYVGYDYTSLEWAPYGDHWRNLRRLATLHALSSHQLKLLSGVRAAVVRGFIRGLFKDSSEKHVVEMKSAFFRLTLTNMMKMIAGSGVEETDAVRRYRQRVERSFVAGGAFDFGDYLPVLRWFAGGASFEQMMKKLHEENDGFAQELIDGCRRAMGSGNGDSDVNNYKKTKSQQGIVHLLLSMQESDPEYYTDELIKSFILTLLSTGTGTTAGTLEWALSLLLNHPQVLAKARAEIDEHVGSDHLLDESDLKHLPYLHCIIKETLRMYPAGPLTFHVCSSECTIAGYRVPRGTHIIYNLWAIQNDPRIWKEPTRFEPERFQGVQGNRVGFEMMPFGSGRRSCPGEGLATLMLQLVLGVLVQCFEWERVGAEPVGMAEGRGLACAKIEPLRARCRPRRAIVDLLSSI